MRLKNPFSFQPSRLNFAFWRETLLFCLLWASLVAWMILRPLIIMGHRTPEEVSAITYVVLFAGSVAMMTSRSLVALLLSHSARQTRFAAMVALLCSMTIGLIALTFALYFRQYFAQWHWPLTTSWGLAQFVFTTAYAVYLFASNSLHQLVSPLFMAGLFVISWVAEPGQRNTAEVPVGGKLTVPLSNP